VAHPSSINVAMLADATGGVDWYFNGLLAGLEELRAEQADCGIGMPPRETSVVGRLRQQLRL